MSATRRRRSRSAAYGKRRPRTAKAQCVRKRAKVIQQREGLSKREAIAWAKVDCTRSSESARVAWRKASRVSKRVKARR